MELIHSKENALIKNIKKLKEKRYRTEYKQFIIEGFRFVEEALLSVSDISYVFINEKHIQRWENSKLPLLVRVDTKIFILKEAVFTTLASTENPQGVIAVVNTKTRGLEAKNGFYVLVDRIQDPGNMGTIIRTSHAGGALGVIYTKGTVDIYNEKTLRATMGSVFHIPVLEDVELALVKELKSQGFKLVVSSLDTDKNFFDVNLKENIIICIGNEGAGVSKEIMDLCDISVKIPMPGGAESLNAAVAGSIMIYETVRQRLTQ